MHKFQSFLSPQNPLILQFLLKQALELQSDSTHHHSKYAYNDRAWQPQKTGFSNQAKVQWEDSGSPHEQHKPSFYIHNRGFFIISFTFKEILK